MAPIPFHSNSWVMKSMETFSHGSFGIGIVLYNPYFFLYMDFVLWHLTQVRTKCFTFCFILGQYNLFPMATFMVCSPQCFAMGMSCSSCIIFHAQLPYWHIDLRLLPIVQSFFKGDVFHLPLFTQFFKMVLSKQVLHVGLFYLPLQVAFPSEDGL